MTDDSAQNRRKTHHNAVNRIKLFVRSDEFKTASRLELEQKRVHLEKSFADFTQEHMSFVHWIDKEQFAIEDRYFATVESVYQRTLLDLRKRTTELEAKELIERNQKSGSSAEKMDPDSSSEGAIGNEIEQNGGNRMVSVVRRIEQHERYNEQRERQRRTYRPAHWNERQHNDLRQKLKRKRPYRPIQCHFCKEKTHPIFKCLEFKDLSIAARRTRLETLGLCINCLQPMELSRPHRCTHGSCWRCGNFHNSLVCSVAVK